MGTNLMMMRGAALTRRMCLALALAVAACSPGGEAEKPPEVLITGAGATFVAPLYAKWASAYRTAKGRSVNYQSVGSGAGIAQIVARTVDFGATDDPMKPEDLEKNQLVQFPAIIGSLVVIVNVPGVATGQLKLNPGIIAAIYAGKITRWNDPAIVAINPDIQLRPIPVTPVYRSDSSGTTAVFTKYMTKATPGWTLGAGKTISWPVGTGGKGNDGIAANVKNGTGTIGYVEYNYASANRLTMTQLSNADGVFLVPSPASFRKAAEQADWPNAAGATVDLLNLPGAETWPIVSASYVLVPRQPTNPEMTRAVLEFFGWSFANGGATAESLGYLALPPGAIERARIEWARVLLPPAKPKSKTS